MSRRQSVFFLLVDPRKEDHKDPEYIDYTAPRLARYLQNAWKRHQDTVFWVDIDLGIREGLVFYQTRSNAIILQGTLPAHCIVRAERLRNGENCMKDNTCLLVHHRRSLENDLNWSKGKDQGSTVEHRPVGKFVQQSLGETLQSGSSKPTQSPKPLKDRTGQPVTKRLSVSCKKNLVLPIDRGNPIERKKNASEITMDRGNPIERKDCTKCKKIVISKIVIDADKFNLATDDENIDFNISGIPDETVKRSQSFNIHDLIQRIASHPQQEAVQNDLEQHQSFNAFSDESKVAIMDAGNTEICEIINVEPKWQCKVCLKHCSTGIIYCTCGHLMTKDSAENRKYISAVLDTFSIPNFYIRKHRPHGHRYGKAPGCKDYFTANQLSKKCRKKEVRQHPRQIHPRQNLQEGDD